MKRVWHVILAGRRPFAMIFMEGAVGAEEAKQEARLVWPDAEVE